ncbi:MAG TPA: hypothetical protein VFS90_03800 [Pyrinomonadaceae bacterium]|nr:hypothetical protein [Pyrinomonadaceae bacterium]
MSKILAPHDYARSVFINCPFDKDYEPLSRAIVFAIRDLNLKPRSAMHVSDGGQPRINKILELIENCKFSIHDICRTELDPVNGLPRFNMPFELGLDLGCKRYRISDQEDKLLLILDTERDRYRTFLSDIAGQDIANHNGSVEAVISIVRDWLRPYLNPSAVTTQSGRIIYRRYKVFQVELPAYCEDLRWDFDNLSFADFSWAAYDWIKNNPI